MAAPTRATAPTTPYTGMAFSVLQEMVLNAINLTVTDADSTTLARVKSLINEAVARIGMAFPGLVHLEKYWTITTVAAQATYSVPKGLIHIIDPIILDGNQVYSIPLPYVNRTQTSTTTAAQETTTRYYSTFGYDNAAVSAQPQAIIQFHPAPDAAGTAEVYGRGLDDALSGDTDVLRIPVAFNSSPYWYAVIPLLHERGRIKEMGAAQAKWDADMGEIMRLAQRSRTAGMTLQWPNYLNSGRKQRYRGTVRIIP